MGGEATRRSDRWGEGWGGFKLLGRSGKRFVCTVVLCVQLFLFRFSLLNLKSVFKLLIKLLEPDSQDASSLPPRGRLEACGQLPLLDFLFKPGLTTARHALHKEAERAPDDGGSEEDTDGRHHL